MGVVDRRLPSNLGLRPLLLRFEDRAMSSGGRHRSGVACRPRTLPSLATGTLQAPQTCSCSNETLWDVPVLDVAGEPDHRYPGVRLCAVCDMGYAMPRFGGDPAELRRDGLIS